MWLGVSTRVPHWPLKLHTETELTVFHLSATPQTHQSGLGTCHRWSQCGARDQLVWNGLTQKMWAPWPLIPGSQSVNLSGVIHSLFFFFFSLSIPYPNCHQPSEPLPSVAGTVDATSSLVLPMTLGPTPAHSPPRCQRDLAKAHTWSYNYSESFHDSLLPSR